MKHNKNKDNSNKTGKERKPPLIIMTRPLHYKDEEVSELKSSIHYQIPNLIIGTLAQQPAGNTEHFVINIRQ